MFNFASLYFSFVHWDAVLLAILRILHQKLKKAVARFACTVFDFLPQKLRKDVICFARPVSLNFNAKNCARKKLDSFASFARHSSNFTPKIKKGRSSLRSHSLWFFTPKIKKGRHSLRSPSFCEFSRQKLCTEVACFARQFCSPFFEFYAKN